MEFEKFYGIMVRKQTREKGSPERDEDVRLGIKDVYRKVNRPDLNERDVELYADIFFSGFLTGMRKRQRAEDSGLVGISKS